MVRKHGTVLEGFDGLDDRMHVFLAFVLFALIVEFAEEEVESLQVVLLSQRRIMAHQSHQPMDNIGSLWVLADNWMELFIDPSSYMFVFLASLLEGLLSCCVEQRLMEATSGGAHDSVHELLLFLRDCGQTSEYSEESSSHTNWHGFALVGQLYIHLDDGDC